MGLGRSGDAKSITVTAPAGGVVDGELYRISGFNGVAFATAVAGAQVALDIDPTGAFEITIPAALNPAVGDVLYMPPASGGVGSTALTTTAAGNVAAVKVRKAKDANNVIEAQILNIS